MQNREPNSHDTTPEELDPHYNTMASASLSISNTILLYLRKGIGYRLIQPASICRITLLLFGLGYFEFRTQEATIQMQQDGLAMMILAVLTSMMAGAHQRKSRPELYDAQTHVHTRSRGHSLWMPFFRILRIPEPFVQRFLEPTAVCLLGCYLIEINWVLVGIWLSVSSTALAIAEGAAAKIERRELMDFRDSRAAAYHLKARDEAPPLAEEKKARPAQREQTAAASPELLRLKRSKTSKFHR